MPPSLMLHSHTRPNITISTSALLRSLTQVSTSRTKRELVIQATMPLLFSMPRDSKTYPLFQESEISLEFTELLSDSTTIKDSSMPVCSTRAHGHFSPQTRRTLLKKLERSMETKLRMFPTNSLENIIVLTRMKEQY